MIVTYTLEDVWFACKILETAEACLIKSNKYIKNYLLLTILIIYLYGV